MSFDAVCCCLIMTLMMFLMFLVHGLPICPFIYPTVSHLAGQSIDAHQDDHEHGQQKGAEVEDVRARGNLSDENHDHCQGLMNY